MKELLDTFFRRLEIREPDLQQKIHQHATVTHHLDKDSIIRAGEYIKVLRILLDGKVRVFQESEDREILIYYLSPMETCTLSLSASLGDCISTVSAQVEDHAIVLNIPVHYVKDWVNLYPSWNNFTLHTFRHSYDVLMDRYAKLAFTTLHERLVEYLYQEAKTQNAQTLYMSHQQIANELGTTREVVSRLLKKLEKAQRVKLGQKAIQIL
ncbi:MAG TPA: hypothetical protein DCS93_23290 [Microscillaceae bacterium]|nr:hypothetical protein [Microscillaceae bacterium]